MLSKSDKIDIVNRVSKNLALRSILNKFTYKEIAKRNYCHFNTVWTIKNNIYSKNRISEKIVNKVKSDLEFRVKLCDEIKKHHLKAIGSEYGITLQRVHNIFKAHKFIYNDLDTCLIEDD